MVVDFKQLNLKERPTLVLRNMDCVAFGVLGRAFNLTADLKFNEVSSISFDYPAFDNGEPVPFYDQIRALGIIEVKDLGQFILEEAKRTTDGIREVKSCTAYSLEYELTYKQFFAEKGTYNFWNPVAPQNTILGMILEAVPYWSLGDIDPALIGKYRTFEAENENVFEFIKNTVQSAYGCIFTFDTYTRKINVMSVASFIPTSQVFLSLDNLIKDIEMTESTENHITCIEPFGADGLSIRSVNPTGTNKIINLDYFMIKENVSQSIIDKWTVWKKLFDDRQLPYYNLTIEESIQSSRLLTEKSVLTDMKGELKKLEALQSASVQYLGEHPHDAGEQEKLDKINASITAQENVIKAQEGLLVTVQADIDAVTAEKTAINKELAFETSFTADEVSTLSKYIKESSVQDSSFVVSNVKDYNTADTSSKHENAVFAIVGATVTRIANPNNKELYSIVGGTLTCPCGEKALSSNVVRGTLERKNTGDFVFSAYLNTGKIGDVPFPSGNISVTGVAGAVSTDVVPATDTPDAYETGTRLSFTASEARVYFTQNATEYEARSVQFDLYDYAKLCLDKASAPSYSFSLESANFLALDEFILFKNNFTLGQRVYLDIEAREVPIKILKPVVIGIKIDFETLSNFSLEFSNKFTTNDAAPSIVDMLQQSISMGKKFNKDQYALGEYHGSGAATAVDQIVSGIVDVSKNEIMSSTGQAISWDGNGLRLRKWNADHTGYEPQQIWMNENCIVFTNDNWATAKMAVGQITMPSGEKLFGVAAEALASVITISKNLYLTSGDTVNGIKRFNFDELGAFLNNAAFVLEGDGGSGQLLLDPRYGFVGGYGPVNGSGGIYRVEGTTVIPSFVDENGDIEFTKDGTPKNANFFIDISGHLYAKDGTFSGKVYATEGVFNGTVYAKDGEFTGKLKAAILDGELVGGANGGLIKGVALDIGDGNYTVDKAGDVTMAGSINMSKGKINWGSNIPNKQRYAASKSGPWHDSMQDGDIYCCDWNYTTGTWGVPYPKVGQDGKPGSNGSDANVPDWVEQYTKTATYIDDQWVIAPNIAGGNITALEKMEAACDFHVGNNIYLGQYKSGGKSIFFNEFANISSTSQDSLSISCENLDLAMISHINWGNNAPKIYFE